jgi:PAS domain S-box-containing protein
MSATLRVLIVEDSEDDTLLLLQALGRGPWEVVHERVDTPEAMSAAFDKKTWDLIIADYSMPLFSGPAALELAVARASDLPFILVSGVMGEEIAVQAMKAGADDFISKGSFARLVPAVERELNKAEKLREARRIESTLRKREERLAAALQLAQVGTWHLDIRTKTVIWSDEAGRLLGLNSKQPTPGLDALLASVHPGDRTAITDLLLHPETKRFTRELRMTRTDGATQYLQIHGDIVRDSNLTVVEMAGTIEEITESKRVERELASAMKAAEAASRSKSEFLANMSHEIRTPMTAILGFAEMLQNKTPKECEEIGCVQIIRRNALHLLELINEILDLSKIEASKMNVECIACNVPELLADVIALMRPRASEKGLAFGVTFVGPIPVLIQTDPMRLRQILVNLLGNAIKFTKIGKIQMRVSDTRAGGDRIALCVEVIDSGIGMTSDQLERLFQPFTQGDASITRKFGGTGLGLTISQRLARLLNGDVTVASSIGIGSTFMLKIDGGPSAGVEMLKDLTEETLPVQTRDSLHHTINLSGRILLVEDGRDNQRLLRTLLTDAGAVVAIAENGQIGVELATTQPFDLILMDMQMPLMDGYAATSELRRLGIKTPIIALTAFAMAEDRGRCMAIGCTAYLSKPVDEDTLLENVNQHLQGAHSLEHVNGKTNGCAAPVPPAGAVTDSGPIKSSFATNPRLMKIIPEFVDGLPAEVNKMIDLLQRQDLPALKRVVHQLLGACGGYGFEPVSKPASKAEESIKASKAVEFITVEINSLIEVIRRIEGYDESKAARQLHAV